MARPIKSLELHYPTIQFLIKLYNIYICRYNYVYTFFNYYEYLGCMTLVVVSQMHFMQPHKTTLIAALSVWLSWCCSGYHTLLVLGDVC